MPLHSCLATTIFWIIDSRSGIWLEFQAKLAYILWSMWPDSSELGTRLSCQLVNRKGSDSAQWNWFVNDRRCCYGSPTRRMLPGFTLIGCRYHDIYLLFALSVSVILCSARTLCCAAKGSTLCARTCENSRNNVPYQVVLLCTAVPVRVMSANSRNSMPHHVVLLCTAVKC